MKYKPGRGQRGAQLAAMNSMLSRDGRRDVIKMAVVIGSGSDVNAHRTSVSKSSLGESHFPSVALLLYLIL